ncbi:hypothetical protein B484DRAFT_161338 [Ochromonadaceae sp. CCMP2298]|nr:hypothetical protein B484DRAFT_161338 [Ochromonadaceae sp. CCMP2298]
MWNRSVHLFSPCRSVGAGGRPFSARVPTWTASTCTRRCRWLDSWLAIHKLVCSMCCLYIGMCTLVFYVTYLQINTYHYIIHISRFCKYIPIPCPIPCPIPTSTTDPYIHSQSPHAPPPATNATPPRTSAAMPQHRHPTPQPHPRLTPPTQPLPYNPPPPPLKRSYTSASGYPGYGTLGIDT